MTRIAMSLSGLRISRQVFNSIRLLGLVGLMFASQRISAQTPVPSPTAAPLVTDPSDPLAWHAEDTDAWKHIIHDMKRPLPPASQPKSEAELAPSAKAPTNAIILFDGKDLSAWQPSKWFVRDGYVEVTPHSGYLISKQPFGSCRLHLEWWTPDTEPLKNGQNRGNSGVFLMGLYEIQVLDTYNNPTYADGIAGSVYGQYPPTSNPIRPPGHWQYYDIEFHHPVFDAKGNATKPARVTVDFNGVRVQDNVEILGKTSHGHRTLYQAHPDALPLQLQDHHEVVRFRNIWIVPLDESGTSKRS